MAKQMNKDLTKEQKQILFDKGTEAPFSGKFVDHKDNGMYTCVNCGKALFDSKTKFESGSGWPSFYDVAKTGAVKLVDDSDHGMQRTEVICSNCGVHLGHVFEDAYDQPTGQRFCINSACLAFEPKSKK
jgi:peptide-methionine (R)-S-oxide reductase